jgi:amino-acid N-acetyltransferase
MRLQIVPSKLSDLPAVLTLLEEARLPTEGVAQHFADFLIVQANERVVGCIGLERYGSYGLLRSLAVAPEFHGQKLSIQLVTHLLAYAQANLIDQVVLLTTTAAELFTRHFGFERIDRQQLALTFAASPEWNLSRCAQAVCLILKLTK